MKVLYVGDLWLGSTALQRLEAIKVLHECDAIDSTMRHGKLLYRILYRLIRTTGISWDVSGLNKKIKNKITSLQYDIIWIDKGIWVFPKTLNYIKKKLPRAISVSYSPDDMINPRNQTPWYKASIKLFDVNVTTKSYNVEELKLLGAKDVLFVDKAYDPSIHRRMELTPSDRVKFQCDVGFIGSWELDRYQHIRFLAEQGIKVTVRGTSWKKFENTHPNIIIIPKNEWADNYAKVLNATKINLCFLKKENRDLQTARSIEIPACGGFMIAERTNEHLRLFEENKEAVFFSSKEELAEKVNYYLLHEEERQRIADAGHLRCIQSGYSNQERLESVIQKIVWRRTDNLVSA